MNGAIKDTDKEGIVSASKSTPVDIKLQSRDVANVSGSPYWSSCN